jgi:hypothetical protein
MGLSAHPMGEKPLLFSNCCMEAPLSPLSSRAKPRDLQFSGPLVEMFFDRALMVQAAIFAGVGHSEFLVRKNLQPWAFAREFSRAESH